jgi:hypothetical protein
MNQSLFNKIKEHFFAALETGTSYRTKDEVKQLYLEACAKAMLEWIDYTEPFLPQVGFTEMPEDFVETPVHHSDETPIKTPGTTTWTGDELPF